MKQMPVQMQGAKPTVAIITSKYYEKLAVDAMMEDKTTFVKYKTEGQLHDHCISMEINLSEHSIEELKAVWTHVFPSIF